MAKSGDPRLKRAYRDGFRSKVLARDGYTCAYCGQEADQVDHVIPISKAPELVVNLDNAVACCRRCNISKGYLYIVCLCTLYLSLSVCKG